MFNYDEVRPTSFDVSLFIHGRNMRSPSFSHIANVTQGKNMNQMTTTPLCPSKLFACFHFI